MSFASMQELSMAIGFKKQSALQTALVAADTWRLTHTNGDVAFPNMSNDSNKDDYGKGTPFATQVFKNRVDLAWPWNARLTSENAAMAAAFGLGKATKTAAGTGFKYTCVPLDPITDGIEMPATTFVQAIRQGASDVFDIANIGVCCESFNISLKGGTGRDTAMIASQWVGCGMYANPSTITIPAVTTEHELPIGAVTTLTIRTVNYLTTKQFVSCELGWKNNIDLERGFYPGSGSVNGFSVRGRMLRGKPEATFSMVVMFENGSTELTDFLAQTEGTVAIDAVGAVIGAGPSTHKLEIDLHRVLFKSFAIREEGTFVACAVECEVLEHTSNGVITIAATCLQDNILTAAT